MRTQIIVVCLAFASVGISVLLGLSEQAGLFGAICSVGAYIAGEIE